MNGRNFIYLTVQKLGSISLIGSILGIGGTFFLFQGRISKLEAQSQSNKSNQPRQGASSASDNSKSSPKPTDHPNTIPGEINYYVRMSKVDDRAEVYVNEISEPVGMITYYDDATNFIPITKQLKSGENKIRFVLYNEIRGWTYDFEIWKNDDLIYHMSCGQKEIYGCKDDDKAKGKVFDETIILHK